MSAEQYATIPETMQLRMIRYSLTGQGCRSKSITVMTTLDDPKQHDAASVAELYGHRWNVELDIRQIKQTLNMDHFRYKSPKIAERELWTMLLGYIPKPIENTRQCDTVVRFPGVPPAQYKCHQRNINIEVNGRTYRKFQWVIV
jgi:hypothetical protein